MHIIINIPRTLIQCHVKVSTCYNIYDWHDQETRFYWQKLLLKNADKDCKTFVCPSIVTFITTNSKKLSLASLYWSFCISKCILSACKQILQQLYCHETFLNTCSSLTWLTSKNAMLCLAIKLLNNVSDCQVKR